jgi:hypothetical protein
MSPNSILTRHLFQIRLYPMRRSSPCHRRQSSIRLTIPIPQRPIRLRRIRSPSSMHLQSPSQIRKNPIRSHRLTRFQQSQQNRTRFRQNLNRCQTPIRRRRSFRCSQILIDSYHRSSMRHRYQIPARCRG